MRSKEREIKDRDLGKETPMMQQYHLMRQQHQGCLLLYRMGDFYEFFSEDAEIVSRLLNIALSRRGESQGKPIPMAGFPCHALDHYLPKLLAYGKPLALCEQCDDETEIQGKTSLVKREVVRVITPGTLTEEGCLKESTSNLLAAVWCAGKEKGYATVELISGKCELFPMDAQASLDEVKEALLCTPPSEVLYPEGESFYHELSLEFPGIPFTSRAPSAFSWDRAKDLLYEQFGVADLHGLGLSGQTAALRAFGALLSYLKETQKASLPHLRPPRLQSKEEGVGISGSTLIHLEVFQSGSEAKVSSLISILDTTKTPMGSRLLKYWLAHPIRNLQELTKRQETVSYFLRSWQDFAPLLGRVGDLERVLGRLSLRTAKPWDWVRLREALVLLPSFKRLLAQAPAKGYLPDFAQSLQPLENLQSLLESAVVDRPPATLREGGVIAPGFHQQLDEWRELSTQGQEYLEAMEKREKGLLKSNTLRVGYSSIHGYYLQLSQAEAHLVPAHYQRIQTLKNAERYTLPELKQYESKLLVARARALALEKEIYQSLFDQFLTSLPTLQRISDAFAELDLFVCLAERAQTCRWRLPKLDMRGGLHFKGLRHPVVEQAIARPFTSNEITLTKETRFLLITGPNMGGKSTYLRQVALGVLLAQIGSAVPAEAAEVGLVDRIFTRVGASDDLGAGRSTFMVEMSEVAYLLRYATEKSLVLLDEVGRGTGTEEGRAIAWAISEKLIELGARTLFSTHYLELGELEARFHSVKNFCVEAAIREGRLIFLHKMHPGLAKSSYGLEVALMAGLPRGVVARARDIYRWDFGRLGSDKASEVEEVRSGESQEVEENLLPWVRKLAQLPVDELTPRKALEVCYNITKEAEVLTEKGQL